ncbi:hypothetical protein GYH30_034520 [Glycine max]|nr:hypothetical protein GYH30_034520 [Glycine max]
MMHVTSKECINGLLIRTLAVLAQAIQAHSLALGAHKTFQAYPLDSVEHTRN